ncbi:hypothetical protein BBJ28_00020749 [Nothophytophthora sp. Chile5]|nr:hypothetical protein BBJ28_00020749 [Nothophytophthora sp. Chile5]
MPSAPESGFGSQAPPAPSVSANAFFGRSPAATEDASSAATHLGEGGVLPPSKSFDHAAQAQASLSRSVSNSSSYADQHATQRSADGTPTRPRQEFPQSQDLNTSYDSVEDHTFGRHASSSSMGQYGYEEAHPSQSPPQQLQGGSSAPAASDPSAFFGQSSASAHEVDASSFFGHSSSQDSAFSTSESHIRQTQEPAAANIVGSADAQSMSQFPSSSSLHSMGGASHHDYGSEPFGASSPAPVGSTMETKLMSAGPQPTGVTDAPTATPETSHEEYGYDEFGGSASTSAGFDASPPAPAPQQSVGSPFSSGNAVNDTPAYDGFGGSAAASFGDASGSHGSSDFFSSAPAPQAPAAVSAHFEHGGYGNEMQQQQQHQQQHVHDAASASLQFAEGHSSFQQPSHAVYGGTGAHASNASATATNNYYQSDMHGAASSPAGYSQQQFPHDDINAHQYMGASVSAQPQDTGYNSVSHHQYGAAASGYGMLGMDQGAHTHTGAAAVVKTSNKYKDPCVAPPSCLASFGFGGNVVTMFPKRKLRLNIAGSSFRNSPRGAPVYV